MDSINWRLSWNASSKKKFNSNFTAAHICQNQNNFFRSVFVNTFHFYNILLVLAIQLILHFYFTGKDRKWRKASKKLSGFLLEKILGWIQLRQCPTGPELRTSRRSRWLQLLKGSVHNTDKNGYMMLLKVCVLYSLANLSKKFVDKYRDPLLNF